MSLLIFYAFFLLTFIKWYKLVLFDIIPLLVGIEKDFMKYYFVDSWTNIILVKLIEEEGGMEEMM